MSHDRQIEQNLRGLSLSEGTVVGRVCMFNDNRHRSLPMYRIEADNVETEIGRMQSARRIASERLSDIQDRVERRLGKAEAGIFLAQRMILEDPELTRQIDDLIRERSVNAETAASLALDAYEARLSEVDSEFLRERASDIGEVRRRLLDVLGDVSPSLQCDEFHCQKGKNRIIVAEELTPSLTVELDTEHVLGFVTERGGRNSHAAILARALGIPAVSGIDGVRDHVRCGTEILVDGTRGEVLISPREETIARVRARRPEAMRMPTAVPPVAGLTVMANINLAAESEEAASLGAEGIGLYRTEMELIAAGQALSEDDLYERYAAVQAAMGDYPVVFRLPDVGSDKPLPYLKTPREDNPALGYRGMRYLLDNDDLFRPQARALARLSQEAEVRVMYPMIVSLAQFVRARRAFEEHIRDMKAGRLRHGVMLEVPAACLQAHDILAEAEFASIGTNDLVQYLFAADRNNVHVVQEWESQGTVLWDLLERMGQAAKEMNRPLSVCGEVGADPALLDRLIERGIRTVSMSARRIPTMRTAALKILGQPAAAT